MSLSNEAAKAVQVSALQINEKIVGISLFASQNKEACRLIKAIRKKGANSKNALLSGLTWRIKDDKIVMQIKSIGETIELSANSQQTKDSFVGLKLALKNPKKMVSVWGRKTSKAFESVILQKDCDMQQIVAVPVECTVH